MNSKEALEILYKNCPMVVTRESDGIQLYSEYLTEVIKQDLDISEQFEKELIQTKKNFRNSQTHSKNCYKKLKEKYEKLEKAYKNNEVMARDLNELITRNLELKDELKKSQETINAWMKNHKKLIIDNGKMKKAWDILKKKNVNLETFNISADLDTYHEILKDNPFYDKLTQEEFELLKEVLQDE